MASNILSFILFLSHPSFSLDTAVSSGTFASTAISLLVDKKQNDSGFYVNYSIRWDFKDLKKAYLLPAFFYRDVVNLDLRKDVRMRYYGYRISPFKFMISERKTDVSGAPGAAPDARASATVKRKLKFSLSPLYEDLEENADRFFLDNSLKSLLPGWGKLTREKKKAFFRDVLSIGVWDAPLLREAAEPMERICD